MSKIFEELSDSQKKLVDRFQQTAKHQETGIALTTMGLDEHGPLGAEQHDDIFEKYTGDRHAEHIILPLHNEVKTEAPPSVKIHLEKHGWDHSQYHTGTATKKYTDQMGNERTRTMNIGKILKDAPEKVRKEYETDPSRANSSNRMQVVISRNKYDVAGMSSGRPWACTSCMRLPGVDASYPEAHEKFGHGNYEIEQGGAYHTSISQDFLHGTMTAFLTKAGDNEIKKPVARINLKKHIGFDENSRVEHTVDHTVFRPEKKTYGDATDSFDKTLHHFSKENWPARPGTKYRKHYDLYDDSNTDFVYSKKPYSMHLDAYGSPTKDEKLSTGIRHFNVNGEEHTDSSDWDKPSTSHFSNMTHITNWKQNGEYHREGDLPASIIHYGDSHPKDFSYDEDPVNHSNGRLANFDFYKHGELHRDNDKPASMLRTSIGDKVKYQWKQHGYTHREGDKPSQVVYSSDGEKISETYSKYGLNHRDDDKPFYTDKNSKLWGQYGELHRDYDKPASMFEENNKISHKITNKWFKHGNAEREGNKPHTEEHEFFHDDNRLRIKRAWDNKIHEMIISPEREKNEMSITKFDNGDRKSSISHRIDENGIHHWSLRSRETNLDDDYHNTVDVFHDPSNNRNSSYEGRIDGKIVGEPFHLAEPDHIKFMEKVFKEHSHVPEMGTQLLQHLKGNK